MVFNGPPAGTGPSKRPASCMQDDGHSWESAPPMGYSMRSSINIPYAHYAMIYLDNMGTLKVTESPSMQEQNGTIFTPEVRDRFLEILGAKIGYQRPMVRKLSNSMVTAHGYGPQQLGHLPYRQNKRRRHSPAHPLYGVHASPAQFPTPIEEEPCASTDMVGLEIGNTPKVIDYYERALKHFQQLNCRQIAKAFIKFIEPRKQVKHPYNGGKPPAGAPPGERGDPEKTKPEWWPPHVVHKEPDHLRKDQRLNLLIHIIRKLERFGITTDQLQEIAHDCKRQLRGPHRLQILDEVFRVRRMEERFERGEVDANTIVYVVNRESNPKQEKDSESVFDPEQRAEQEDENAEDEMPTQQLEANTSGLVTTSVEQMAMPAPSRPLQLGVDRNQLFPLPESLSFGEVPRDDRAFFQAASEFPEDFSSQPMLRNPATTSLVGSNDSAATFDYLSQTSMPSSTAPEAISHHRQVPLPMQHSASFDPWTPSFRHQTVFNPLEYGVAPNHTLSQPSIHYQLPIAPSSHPQDMSQLTHGLPNMSQDRPASMDGMGIRGQSYRNGSLGHHHESLQSSPSS
ncbi:uncharacterized protein ACLA_012530 [Aspergillus clavatus NRRL 1]|uniref:Subtelomeric hrmA-associated cluster protein AFUB-079030/YDR124W-like helical bundle domain-containing protein n=1 Tax=Aspergillus clavatus (strain ATCC 1007 / CBS 513.65 / DSM 816 / NCTC 3887 / NRRL 1 / QM 1276 / 107) TaxID=344612 RepID=A1CAQ7_ASPCL|nr:uncharacterized protein ACLA_012530 [Aspergillus clavatus NRRL 1]EAW12825.1 hypothetical protein ACLA_012530 [Aspergillus clavatus NRRL 1]